MRFLLSVGKNFTQNIQHIANFALVLMHIANSLHFSCCVVETVGGRQIGLLFFFHTEFLTAESLKSA